MDVQGNIRVSCRLKPVVSSGLLPSPATVEFAVQGAGDLTVHAPAKLHTFEFDHVHPAYVDQPSVVEDVHPLVNSVLEGFNVCVFAYGQVRGTTACHTARTQPVHRAPLVLPFFFFLLLSSLRLAHSRDSAGNERTALCVLGGRRALARHSPCKEPARSRGSFPWRCSSSLTLQRPRAASRPSVSRYRIWLPRATPTYISHKPIHRADPTDRWGGGFDAGAAAAVWLP